MGSQQKLVFVSVLLWSQSPHFVLMHLTPETYTVAYRWGSGARLCGFRTGSSGASYKYLTCLTLSFPVRKLQIVVPSQRVCGDGDSIYRKLRELSVTGAWQTLALCVCLSLSSLGGLPSDLAFCVPSRSLGFPSIIVHLGPHSWLLVTHSVDQNLST